MNFGHEAIRSAWQCGLNRPVAGHVYRGKSLVWYVLLIGIVNLSLGFAAAVIWNRFQDLLAVSEDADAPAETLEATEPAADPPPDERTEEQPESTKVSELSSDAAEDVPEEWREMLGDAFEPATFLDAAIEVFQLGVVRYRHELIAIEDRLREPAASASAETINECRAELKRVSDSYLKRHVGRLMHLTNRQEGSDALAEVGSQLVDALAGFSAKIESAATNVDQSEFDTDLSTEGRRLILEIGTLIDQAHCTRDKMQELLVRAMHIDGRIGAIDKPAQVDALTGWYNRLALEKIFDEWWEGDPYRLRTVSAAIIDLDIFKSINQSFGTVAGDLLLREFCKVVGGTMRKQRNYDVAMRYSGQRFAVFFGDTGAPNAINAVERMRQTVEATVFEYDDKQIDVTFTAGVVEVHQDDTSASVLDRAVQTMQTAKEAGRNCTYIAEKGDPEPVTPRKIKVHGQICPLKD